MKWNEMFAAYAQQYPEEVKRKQEKREEEERKRSEKGMWGVGAVMESKAEEQRK